MFAFVDETGHTGSNIFDKAQPDFLLGALVTKSNFSVVHRSSIRSICNRVGVTSLHAAVIGPGPIEDAAPDILRLLKKIDARFFISRVEKRYLLAAKFYDTFFDSGENPAVPWSVYNIRLLRMTLCFKVATLLTEKTAREFWAMLMARNEQQARMKIPDICDAVLEYVPELGDARSREIVTDALSWSKNHPEALNIFIPRRQAKNGHMPNVVAFANLMNGLDDLSRKWKRPLKKIIHDRQSQFEGALAELHRLYSTAPNKSVRWVGETIPLQRVVGSTFETSVSDDNSGIQVVDTVLWLFRQFLKGREIRPGSGALLNYVFKKAYCSDFSFKGVGEQVERQFGKMMSADMTEEQLKEGQQMIEKTEQHRQKMISLYEEDGLMPYQRYRPKLVGEDDD